MFTFGCDTPRDGPRGGDDGPHGGVDTTEDTIAAARALRSPAGAALCGDARHTIQEPVRLPQRELECRANGQGGPGEGR